MASINHRDDKIEPMNDDKGRKDQVRNQIIKKSFDYDGKSEYCAQTSRKQLGIFKEL